MPCQRAFEVGNDAQFWVLVSICCPL